MSDFVSLVYENESSGFSQYDLNDFLLWCVDNNVSDITIQNEDRVMCEIYGKKHFVINKRLSKADVIGIITKLHSDGALSKLNSGEELDFAYVVKRNREEYSRFRVNLKSISLNLEKGYSISLRVLNNRPPSVELLNLPQDMFDAFNSRKGMILVTGPTGSGKSTLLASIILHRLESPKSHLKFSTYESPIEFTFEDVIKPTSSISQMEIGINIPSFAAGVRNSLRTRSDVVLVGECRDLETISATINAVMTGPLVYSTAHTNNVSEIIARLINEFPENERLSRLVDLVTNVRMLVTQKLIPSLDGKRVAIREYLIFNQEIVDLLLETSLDKITYKMRKLVADYGVTFLEDLTKKYNDGLISKEVFDEVKKDLI